MSFPNANYNFNVVNEANLNSIVSNALSVAGDLSLQGNLVVGGDVSTGGDINMGGGAATCSLVSACPIVELLSLDADGSRGYQSYCYSAWRTCAHHYYNCWQLGS